MRWLSCGAVAAIIVASAAAAYAQSYPTAPDQPPAGSRAASAIRQAAAAQKYLFVLFWRDDNAQTQQAWQVLQATAGRMPDRVTVTAVSINDPTEKAIVDRFDLTRAPMPMVLSLGPCGAVTKAFTGRVDENQLQAAFVSPCTEKCMKALQDRKLVFLCVHSAPANLSFAAIKGVQDFKADPRYAAHTEVVQLNSAEPAEAAFVRELQIDPRTSNPVTVFLAPPGTIVGKFEGAVTKDQLMAKLASAQSSSCPGGKCGPGGCGPKK